MRFRARGDDTHRILFGCSIGSLYFGSEVVPKSVTCSWPGGFLYLGSRVWSLPGGPTMTTWRFGMWVRGGGSLPSNRITRCRGFACTWVTRLFHTGLGGTVPVLFSGLSLNVSSSTTSGWLNDAPLTLRVRVGEWIFDFEVSMFPHCHWSHFSSSYKLLLREIQLRQLSICHLKFARPHPRQQVLLCRVTPTVCTIFCVSHPPDTFRGQPPSAPEYEYFCWHPVDRAGELKSELCTA